MLMPSIFGENLLDDFFGEPFGGYDYSESGLMTTDVKDTDKGYEVTMNMPGVKKEDVKAELKDGYLTVSAENSKNKDEKDEDGIKCYASKYVLNNGKLKLTQITDEKDYNFVCEVLNSIQNDGGKNEN